MGRGKKRVRTVVIRIQEDTREALHTLKRYWGYRTLDQVIKFLIRQHIKQYEKRLKK